MSNLKFNTINEVFSAHFYQSFDREFVLKYVTYVNNFVRKDENSINFFGGPLIGVYRIVWSQEDKIAYIEDVMEFDDMTMLTKDLHSLPGINKDFHVSGDVINHSFLWVAYKALTSDKLNDNEKRALSRSAVNMLQYKFISSIQNRFFKYPADMGVALAVYEQLDKKSIIKKQGSWGSYVEFRTSDILGEGMIHSKVIRELETEHKVCLILNDIWTRVKSVFKILTNDFNNIRVSQGKLLASDKFVTVDGENIIKDYFNEYNHIKTRIAGIIPDKNGFIKEELMDVVINVSSSVYKQYLNNGLLFISENYHVTNKHVNLPELIDDCLMFAFNIIRKEKIDFKDIPTIAVKMRGYLRSSRVTTPEFISIKNRMAFIVETSNPKISEAVNAATRIGLVLYIILRALLKV
jgi:hypothetical protein